MLSHTLKMNPMPDGKIHSYASSVIVAVFIAFYTRRLPYHYPICLNSPELSPPIKRSTPEDCPIITLFV